MTTMLHIIALHSFKRAVSFNSARTLWHRELNLSTDLAVKNAAQLLQCQWAEAILAASTNVTQHTNAALDACAV